ADARILWETPPHCPNGAGWTPLLPQLTGRFFIGGLDALCGIEHTNDGLTAEALAGRPLAGLNDEDLAKHLAEYCRLYNVGWVVCWTKETVARFSRWPLAQPVARLGPQREGVLFALRRRHSYILEGQ